MNDQGYYWIPVVENLPRDEGYYVVTALWSHKIKPESAILYYRIGHWYNNHADASHDEWRISDCVIAWRPLPPPYAPAGETALRGLIEKRNTLPKEENKP